MKTGMMCWCSQSRGSVKLLLLQGSTCRGEVTKSCLALVTMQSHPVVPENPWVLCVPHCALQWGTAAAMLCTQQLWTVLPSQPSLCSVCLSSQEMRFQWETGSNTTREK